MCGDVFPTRPDWVCDREGAHELHRCGSVMWCGSWVPDHHDATSGGEH